MKVKMLMDWWKYKKDQVLELKGKDESIGHQMIGSGVAQVVSFDPPPPEEPVGVQQESENEETEEDK